MSKENPKKSKAKKDKTEEVLAAWKVKEEAGNQSQHKLGEGIIFLILFGFLVWGFFTNNFLLSIIAILIGLLFYLLERREAREYKFKITWEGVEAYGNLYEYDSLENFWIFYDKEEDGKKELSLKSKKIFSPYIRIPLKDMDPVEVREILINFLPEEKHEEGVVDFLEKYI